MNINRWLTGLGTLAALLLLMVWNRGEQSVQRHSPVSDEPPPPAVVGNSAAEAATREAPSPYTSDSVGDEARETAAVVPGEIQPILGQSLKFRELRGAGGALRNLEFVVRRGVLPRRLFSGTRQLIDSYRPLYRNSVGYGAATVFFLYQLVREDRNGDGRLTRSDGVDLAISRPDGSDFRILDRGLQAVAEIEHFPAQDRLRLAVEVGGTRESREYALSGG